MIAWLLLIAVLIVALVGWLLFLGAQRVAAEVARKAQNMRDADERTMAFDRELFLFVLRRELANYLVNHDADRYLRLYREARTTEITLNKAERAAQETELKKITDKYPVYENFDFVESREYVLYADDPALGGHAVEDIERHYLNMVKFHVLQRILIPSWSERHAATSDQELKHLEKYVQKIKDTKFRERMIAAVDEFYRHRPDETIDGQVGKRVFETKAFSVYYVIHNFENRYGFYFKDTHEYGLYSSFHSDDDKIYRNYYRSNSKFE